MQLETPPTIDGEIKTDEWAKVPTGEGFVDYMTNSESPEKGKFWLAYDAKFIYFAAQLDDSQPDKISAQEYRTNTSMEGDDAILLILDPLGSLTDFNAFQMNPRGATTATLAGGRALKREWAGEFQAKGRITTTGWEVEAKVPWALMTLPSTGKHTLRFNVRRKLQRTQRQYVWQYVNGGNISNMGKWLDVEVPKVDREQEIKLLPYLYLGGADKRKAIANSGLDLKTAFDDKVHVVGSINPDFRNIENDILSLDFSYFDRLGNESRPFFQEGADYRNITINGTRTFASQRVGAFDAGINTYGKVGKNLQFSVLDVATFGRQNVFNTALVYTPQPTTDFDLVITKNSEKGKGNDSVWFNAGTTIGETYIYANHAQTKDDELGAGKATSVGVYRNNSGLQTFLEFSEISQNYFPRLGLIEENDSKGVLANVEWLRTHPRGAIGETEVSTTLFQKWHMSGKPYQKGANVQFSVTGRNGLDLDFGAIVNRFEGFDDYRVYGSLELPRGNPYRHWDVGFTFGKLQGIEYRNLAASVQYRPVKDLQLALGAQSVRYDRNRDQIILSANYDLGHDQSISGRAVKTGGDINAYIAFRRSGNKGAEYFLILGDPNARKFQASLVLKAVFPISIKF